MTSSGRRTILEARRWFWPVILVPYSIEHAHTRAFTGREVVKDIKASLSRAKVTLTDEAIVVTGRLTQVDHLIIPLPGITSVVPQQQRLVRIEFEEAHMSALMKVMLSGQPGGSRHCILLNPGDRDAWVDALRSATA